MASAEPQRRPPKTPKDSVSGTSAAGRPRGDNGRNERTDTSNAGYDAAVRAGESREEQPDVFERLERVDADLDTGIADNLDPEDLVAELEGANAGSDVDSAALDDLDEVATEEREWSGAGESDNESQALSRARSAGDEDGSVSPEELGEQFLRNAVQQDFQTSRNDRESNDNVDLLAEPPHQVSLFDHNLDPLADPRFPQVVADETRADAEHRSGTAASAKRAATRKAQDQTAKAKPKRSRG